MASFKTHSSPSGVLLHHCCSNLPSTKVGRQIISGAPVSIPYSDGIKVSQLRYPSNRRFQSFRYRLPVEALSPQTIVSRGDYLLYSNKSWKSIPRRTLPLILYWWICMITTPNLSHQLGCPIIMSWWRLHCTGNASTTPRKPLPSETYGPALKHQWGDFWTASTGPYCFLHSRGARKCGTFFPRQRALVLTS